MSFDKFNFKNVKNITRFFLKNIILTAGGKDIGGRE